MNRNLQLTTDRDTSTTVYFGWLLRVSAFKPWYEGENLRITTETYEQDRLGAEQWIPGGDLSWSEIDDLAAHVCSVRKLKPYRGMYWTCIAGPRFGYRLLIKPASWICRLVGKKYEYCVERNYGRGGLDQWRSAESANVGTVAHESLHDAVQYQRGAERARIAWFLKQELYQTDLDLERVKPRPDMSSTQQAVHDCVAAQRAKMTEAV